MHTYVFYIFRGCVRVRVCSCVFCVLCLCDRRNEEFLKAYNIVFFLFLFLFLSSTFLFSLNETFPLKKITCIGNLLKRTSIFFSYRSDSDKTIISTNYHFIFCVNIETNIFQATKYPIERCSCDNSGYFLVYLQIFYIPGNYTCRYT